LTHLAVTGGMAAGEGFIDQIVGHGVAAKLSARLGEGIINGILTARIGLATIAVCRPLPFAARPAPTLREVAGGLFDKSAG
jgi:putative membrane protein